MNHNELYPVFLKLNQLQILIVGGGFVAEEKLSFIVKSSPDARVRLVAIFFRENTRKIADKYGFQMIERSFKRRDLKGHQLVIATTDDEQLNIKIHDQCKRNGTLVNVADNPRYCDFYMGGIVSKGHLKVAISTNGKSPTVTKRLRQFFEQVLPDDLDNLLNNLNEYRKTIEGNFSQKVEHLNELTKDLLKKSTH